MSSTLTSVFRFRKLRDLIKDFEKGDSKKNKRNFKNYANLPILIGSLLMYRTNLSIWSKHLQPINYFQASYKIILSSHVLTVAICFWFPEDYLKVWFRKTLFSFFRLLLKFPFARIFSSSLHSKLFTRRKRKQRICLGIPYLSENFWIRLLRK